MRRSTRARITAVRNGALLLAILLPALVVGPTLGGRGARLHSHGEQGAHVHLVPAGADAGDHGAVEGWHAIHHHDHHGGREPRGHDAPTPSGTIVRLPPVIAVSTPTTLPLPRLGPTLGAPSPARLVEDPVVERFAGTVPRRCGWPPQRGRRGGVAGLLRSSHAIRI